jgi:RNA polymerase sigma-70 factor (ECF subfamily)
MPLQQDLLSPTLLVRHALEQYESSLISYAASILNGDEERARDVVQDTLLKLYLADPLRVSENLKAWLYAVCRNRCLDVLRKEHRLVFSEDGLAPELSDNWQPDPGEEAERDEMLCHVWSTTTQLPDNQREVIRLKFQHGLSYKDIARVTGLSVTNVGFLLHTGIKRLRKLLRHALTEN